MTVRGRVEAVAAGQLLRSKGFKAGAVDVAFSSELQRAHETCELTLASMAGPDQHTWCAERVRRDRRLNERHYGVVQGLYKDDPALHERFSPETIVHWRRSVEGKPPPLDETHEHYLPPPAPRTESLADCQARVLECFHERIAPAMFDEDGSLPTPPSQRTTLVVAHSNTIRGLMAAFDGVPADRVPRLHVPNGVPVLYRFDADTRRITSTRLQAAAGGSHARWLVGAANHRAVRRALQPGGLLTRALFDALDARGTRRLTSEDINRGLHDLLRDEEEGDIPPDWVVVALAKKIGRELKPGEYITLQEFERRAAEAYMGLQLPHLMEEEQAA